MCRYRAIQIFGFRIFLHTYLPRDAPSYRIRRKCFQGEIRNVVLHLNFSFCINNGPLIHPLTLLSVKLSLDTPDMYVCVMLYIKDTFFEQLSWKIAGK